MQQTESYDVLRLIEHGQICYISSEHVSGKVLVRYLKYHPVIEKEMLFGLLKEIAGQLELIHRCRGNPCYQYVNPYSMIMAEDGNVYFLDMQAESNRDQIRFMQRRGIREYFLPSDGKYYQCRSKEQDIYGLGKTFQYILASTDVDPHLNRREEYRLKRIISKAVGKQTSHYSNVSEVQRQIPSYKEKKTDKKSENKGKRRKIWCILLLFAMAAGGFFFIQQRKNEKPTVQKEIDNLPKRQTENRDEEYLELALAYFLNVGDTEKSLKALKKIENKTIVKPLRQLIRAYEKKEIPGDEEEYKKDLIAIENAWKERSRQTEEKRKQEIQCLARGYSLLEDEKSVEKVLVLVKEGLQMDYLNDPLKRELLQYQAEAFEKLDKKEEAAKIYTEILEIETQSGRREQLYKQITQLYESAGRRDMANDMCLQGIKELGESKELKVMHIRLLCTDSAVSREECAQKIAEYTENDGTLWENEAFKKLQKEYDIKAEGENIWVGR